jgi:hypothetical protein
MIARFLVVGEGFFGDVKFLAGWIGGIPYPNN